MVIRVIQGLVALEHRVIQELQDYLDRRLLQVIAGHQDILE